MSAVARQPVDVSLFVGPYPFRHLPHPDPEVLVRVLAREGVDAGWVGHLPSAFHRDPAPGNRELLRLLAPHAHTLLPVPAVRPDWPGWERELDRAAGLRHRRPMAVGMHGMIGCRAAHGCSPRRQSLT